MKVIEVRDENGVLVLTFNADLNGSSMTFTCDHGDWIKCHSIIIRDPTDKVISGLGLKSIKEN